MAAKWVGTWLAKLWVGHGCKAGGTWLQSGWDMAAKLVGHGYKVGGTWLAGGLQSRWDMAGCKAGGTWLAAKQVGHGCKENRTWLSCRWGHGYRSCLTQFILGLFVLISTLLLFLHQLFHHSGQLLRLPPQSLQQCSITRFYDFIPWILYFQETLTDRCSRNPLHYYHFVRTALHHPGTCKIILWGFNKTVRQN